jgi:hypothetical protein
VLLEPAAAPLLPTPSVAVQLTLLIPSLETVRVPLALVVPVPVTPLSTAPEQLIDATFDGSVAATEPVTGEVLNHPLSPLAAGKATITVGGVVSAELTVTLGCEVPIKVKTAPPFLEAKALVVHV